MALRSPEGIHLAFDAQSCRLSYGWTGEFLDMRPVWDGRGGNKAILEGALFWTAPPGFPWDVTPSASNLPDYSQRGADTSLGAILPEDGKLHPSRVHFRKLKTLPDRTTFHYELDLDEDASASFTETVATFRNDLASGITRDISAAAPQGNFLWLHVAEADEAPTWITRNGKSGRFDGSAHAAPALAVVKLSSGGRRFVLHQRNHAADCDWLAIPQGGSWSVILRCAVQGTPPSAEMQVVVLKPLDDQPVTSDRVAEQELKEPKGN
jgi:hypothetical protein